MEKPPTAGDVYVHSSKGLASSPGNTEVPTRVVSIWRQGKAKVNHLLGNKPPETPTRHESDPSTPPPIHQSRPPTPPTWLTSPPKLPAPLPHTPPPYDIAVVIIAYLTHDLRTLKACSLTCRSFFMAAAPHIYHTITLDEARGNRSRLEPLSTLRELGLMPYTREIRVRSGAGSSSWLLPRAFSHFSAFTNVHTLKIQNMEVYRFVPGVERYFGHFSPTLRSITLYNPRCTPRQLSYFLSLFPNLDDINISTETVAAHIPNTTVPDTGLVPFSTSGLRGRLALYEFSWVETLTSLIALGGGLRFRQMDLRRSECCTPLLFEACAKTLETLRFHANDRPVGAPDLSRLEVLRSLQVRAWRDGTIQRNRRHTFVLRAFSTITSSVFSELVIIVGSSMAYLPQNVALFETLRKMHEVRPFKLVFLLEVSDRWNTRRGLAEALNLVTEKGFVDFLESPPTIRTAQTCYSEWDILDFD